MAHETGRQRVIVEGRLGGQRLDFVIRVIDPGISLRKARRLIGAGRVLVNGAPGAAGQKLRPGQILEIAREEAKQGEISENWGAKYLASQGDYHFFYKPPGMHSVSLAGEDGISLEALCPRLLPRKEKYFELLQRLDFNTEGIICAAASESAARKFRLAEKTGECEKHYLAMLKGSLERRITVKNRLDCSRRRKTGVLPDQGEPGRWTVIEPLKILSGENGAAGNATLAHCVIARGQRHQIRAHAAGIGHPLLNDGLYGGGWGDSFQLSHFFLAFTGHEFFYLSEKWTASPAWAELGQSILNVANRGRIFHART